MDDKLKKPGTLGRVTVMVEERPPGRAAVRMHVRQTTADAVLETIALSRERLEQLLTDARKVTEIRAILSKVIIQRVPQPGSLRAFEVRNFEEQMDALLSIERILNEP